MDKVFGYQLLRQLGFRRAKKNLSSNSKKPSPFFYTNLKKKDEALYSNEGLKLIKIDTSLDIIVVEENRYMKNSDIKR